MNNFSEKSLKTLEFDKILDRLSSFTACQKTKELILNIKPEKNLKNALKLIDETEGALKLTYKFGNPSFYGLVDITASAKRAKSGGILSLKELRNTATVLFLTRSLKSYISEEKENVLSPMFFALEPQKSLEEEIFGSILSDEEVADNASSELFKIRRKIISANESIRSSLQKIIHSQSNQKYLQDSVITMRDGRFVVPVKAEHKNDIKGIVHDTSKAGSTVFIEPSAVVEANNEIKMLKIAEKEEIERILTALSAKVGSICEILISNYDIIVDLDLIFAKAAYADEIRGVKPFLNDDGIIDIKKARHPLLDPKTVVPVDIVLGMDFDSLIITGPNTGGKTVTLKTLGLLCLMASCGIFVPCMEESRICVFENIYADIGDEQSIEQSLSTFSSHMKNIVKILDTVSYKDLVLFDELGAGTDPVEGAALAVSIIENVRQKGARLAATTHYAELKTYALTTKGVENASCEFDVNTLRPTYKVLIGVMGKSNAFAISKRLGLSDEVVERAKEFVSSENIKIEDVLDRLEKNRQNIESEKSKTKALNAEIERLKQEIEKERQKLQKEKEQEIEKAKNKAKQILQKTKLESEQLLNDLKEIKKEQDRDKFNEKLREKTHGLKSKIKNMEDYIDPVIERVKENYKLPRALKLGDTVIVRDIDKTGNITALKDKSGSYTVRLGIMTLKVSEDNLKLVESRQEKNISGYIRKSTAKVNRTKAKPELDIRGKTAEEAYVEIDQFLDNACIGGLSQVTIIHGKGTGALRSAVMAYLKGHRHVKSQRPGRYGEGEMGVTVVEIK